MLLLGIYVALRFREERFVPAPTRRLAAARAIFGRGFTLVRTNRAILAMVVATFLVNGATEAGRLYQKRLVTVGFPASPVIWFAGLGLLVLVVGATALRMIEPRIDDSGTAVRGYRLACAAGATGLAGLALAPEKVTAGAAIIFVAGIAVPMTRTLATIWVNRQTTADVRATVHSFLAQAEYFGEIVWGLTIAGVAALAGMSGAFLACAALFVVTSLFLQRAGETGAASEVPLTIASLEETGETDLHAG
jgi:hypothetical protein